MAHSTRTGEFKLPQRVRTLDGVTRATRSGPSIHRRDLGLGDRLIVKTRNSTYSLLAAGDDGFVVRGGWFDRQPDGPVTVTVNGCTFGGSAIAREILAAPGMFLEFGNTVLTTRILEVRVERRSDHTIH